MVGLCEVFDVGVWSPQDAGAPSTVSFVEGAMKRACLLKPMGTFQFLL